MSNNACKTLSTLCFILGFASIVGSIAIWFYTGGAPAEGAATAAEAKAHAERFGIFVGLWAPTFFILSNRFDRFAKV
jgi:hypothetical protein